MSGSPRRVINHIIELLRVWSTGARLRGQLSGPTRARRLAGSGLDDGLGVHTGTRAVAIAHEGGSGMIEAPLTLGIREELGRGEGEINARGVTPRVEERHATAGRLMGVARTLCARG